MKPYVFRFEVVLVEKVDVIGEDLVVDIFGPFVDPASQSQKDREMGAELQLNLVLKHSFLCIRPPKLLESLHGGVRFSHLFQFFKDFVPHVYTLVDRDGALQGCLDYMLL